MSNDLETYIQTSPWHLGNLNAVNEIQKRPGPEISIIMKTKPLNYHKNTSGSLMFSRDEAVLKLFMPFSKFISSPLQ